MNQMQIVDSEGRIQDLADEKCVKVVAGEVYKLRIVMERIGPARNNSSMHLPQWSKPKQAGWIIIVGREFNDQILNTTSVTGSHSTRTTAKMDIRIPTAKGKQSLSLYILSDCYMGIDQEYTLQLDVS
uniref:SEC63 domain-containing protein n=2 Tax=Caenorhabditis tropicalis TaxID=1561998 RepID=A0A1I7UX85_9PELO